MLWLRRDSCCRNRTAHPSARVARYLHRGSHAEMSDDKDHRRIIDRANRMLKQSRTLRRVADELLGESRDLRVSARRIRSQQTVDKPRRKKASRSET